MPEIAVAGTGCDHERVVCNPGIPQDHLAHCGVDVRYLAEQDTNIGLIAKQSADGSGDETAPEQLDGQYPKVGARGDTDR